MKAVVVHNTFWSYCFCCVLLCQKKAVEIFNCVEILIKNIYRFNVYGKAVVCHDNLSIILAKEKIYSLLSSLSDKKFMFEQSFLCYRHKDLQAVREQKPYQRHFLFRQNCTLLYFQGFYLEVSWIHKQFFNKFIWLLLLHLFAKQSPSLSFWRSDIHKLCHQFLLKPYLLFLLLFLLLLLVNQINLLMEISVVLETLLFVVEKNVVDKMVV